MSRAEKRHILTQKSREDIAEIKSEAGEQISVAEVLGTILTKVHFGRVAVDNTLYMGCSFILSAILTQHINHPFVVTG